MIESEFQCIKIKDGLYMGNLQAAQDYQFLVINKFSHIVNCNAQMPNHYQMMGIKYLKFKLIKQKPHKLFNQTLKKLTKLEKFIQDCQQNIMCCLVVSHQNNTRSLVMITAFLMSRFRWTMRKTLQYIRSKGIYITLNDHYVNQLQILQQILSKIQEEPVLSSSWKGPYINDQEEVISKTFLNSQQISISQMNNGEKKQKKTKRVVWKDKFQKQNKKLQKQKKNKDLKLSNQNITQSQLIKQKIEIDQQNEKILDGKQHQFNQKQRQRKSLTSNTQFQKKTLGDNLRNQVTDSNKSISGKTKLSKQRRQKKIGNKSNSLNKISLHSQKGTGNVQSQQRLQKINTQEQYEAFKQGQQIMSNPSNNLVHKNQLLKIIQNNLKIAKNNQIVKGINQSKPNSIEGGSAKKRNIQNIQQQINKVQEKKQQPVYNLTINNFINPNIHIMNQGKNKQKQVSKALKKSTDINKKKNNQKVQKAEFKKTGLLSKNSKNKQKSTHINNQNHQVDYKIKQKLSKGSSVEWKRNKI